VADLELTTEPITEQTTMTIVEKNEIHNEEPGINPIFKLDQVFTVKILCSLCCGFFYLILNELKNVYAFLQKIKLSSSEKLPV
jgi:hypothetical protein